MTFAILCAFAALQAAFIWGRYRVFRIDGRPSPGVRVIEVAATACMFVNGTLIALRDGANSWGDGLAFILALIAAGLFGWGVITVGRHRLTAAFSSDEPNELITAGPFRVVRNPFYSAYLLSNVVALAGSRSPWAAPCLACMTAIYWRAAVLEERKFAESPLREAYTAYCRRAGRFLPRFGLRPTL